MKDTRNKKMNTKTRKCRQMSDVQIKPSDNYIVKYISKIITNSCTHSHRPWVFSNENNSYRIYFITRLHSNAIITAIFKLYDWQEIAFCKRGLVQFLGYKNHIKYLEEILCNISTSLPASKWHISNKLKAWITLLTLLSTLWHQKSVFLFHCHIKGF